MPHPHGAKESLPFILWVLGGEGSREQQRCVGSLGKVKEQTASVAVPHGASPWCSAKDRIWCEWAGSWMIEGVGPVAGRMLTRKAG